jgi:hypothetical protein
MGFHQYKILPYEKLSSCHIDPSEWGANKNVKKKKNQMEERKERRRKFAASDGLTSSKEGNKCYFNLTACVVQSHTKSQEVTLFSQRMKQTEERCFASTL